MYSVFYYFADPSPFSGAFLEEILADYSKGYKLYVVFQKEQQLQELVQKIDLFLSELGLRREGEFLQQNTLHKAEKSELPEAGMKTFQFFHGSFHVVYQENLEIAQNFKVYGCEEGSILMEKIEQNSTFDFALYKVIHAEKQQNIFLEGGVGSGKTRGILERILYLAQEQKDNLNDFLQSIEIIFFHKQEIPQAKSYFSAYFESCFLLTGETFYLEHQREFQKISMDTEETYFLHLLQSQQTNPENPLQITDNYDDLKKITQEELWNYLKSEATLYCLGISAQEMCQHLFESIKIAYHNKINVATTSESDFGIFDISTNYGKMQQMFQHLILQISQKWDEVLNEKNSIHRIQIVAKALGHTEFGNFSGVEGPSKLLFVDDIHEADLKTLNYLISTGKKSNSNLFYTRNGILQKEFSHSNAFYQYFLSMNQEKLWHFHSLRHNYKNDRNLLFLIEETVQQWMNCGFPYHQFRDKQIGTRYFNEYLSNFPEKFYHPMKITKENQVVSVIFHEISRIQRRIEYEESHGKILQDKEKSVTLLVETEGQVSEICCDLYQYGLVVQTNKNIFSSVVGKDLLILLEGILFFDEAAKLYSLTRCNFFSLDVQGMTLHSLEKSIDQKENVIEYLQNLIKLQFYQDTICSNIDDYSWDDLLESSLSTPLEIFLSNIYRITKPWEKYNKESSGQGYYKKLMSELFALLEERRIETFVDLYENLRKNQGENSKNECLSHDYSMISCYTVEESKGMQFGHVILPYSHRGNEGQKKKNFVNFNQTAEKIGYSFLYGPEKVEILNEFCEKSADNIELEQAKLLYEAMISSIRSLSWVSCVGAEKNTWENLLEKGGKTIGTSSFRL